MSLTRPTEVKTKVQNLVPDLRDRACRPSSV
jgi:hypothetical protein